MTGLNIPLDQPRAVRPGEELDVEKLGEYISNTLDLPSRPLQIKQFPQGYSNLTYLISFGESQMVLRRPPFGANIKSGHDMAREYKILRALSTHYTKAPKPLHYCEEPSIIGSPFYLMERVSGVILRTKMPGEHKPGHHLMRQISHSFVDTLAELHAIDYVAAGLEELGRPLGYVERQVKGWTKRYVNSKTAPNTTIDKVMQWLGTNYPNEKGASLIHNDFKYDNLILDPVDMTRILAVLDWEMSTLGDPLMDLGTTLGYWVNQNDPDWMQELALSPTTLPGNPTRAEVAEQYATKSGADLSQIVFYYVFGLFKITVIIQQIYFRYKKGLTSDPRFAELNNAVRGFGNMAFQSLSKNRIDDLF
ncbi:MAG: phosphotransferase family protein [Saprospiraceae bacterium]|nr:phosphotransferase family protein [Saprospiraceae bacterium]